MAPTPRPTALTCTTPFVSLLLLVSACPSAAQSRAWASHSHDAQHTGVSAVASQPLTKIHWKAPVDLAGPALSGNRLFIPDSGGRVIVRGSPNLATGTVNELFFYGQNNFETNPTVYK